MATPNESRNQSVILGGVRTPFTKLNGGLSTKSATDLGSIVIRAALDRTGVDPRLRRSRRHGSGASRWSRAESGASGGVWRWTGSNGDVGDGQPRLWLRHARHRAGRSAHPGRRLRRRCRRRHGEHVERAVCPGQGPRRIPDGERRPRRPDGQGRTALCRLRRSDGDARRQCSRPKSESRERNRTPGRYAPTRPTSPPRAVA